MYEITHYLNPENYVKDMYYRFSNEISKRTKSMLSRLKKPKPTMKDIMEGIDHVG